MRTIGRACNTFARNYLIRNYLSFIDFIKTVTKPSGVLRYGEYIRSIDLTLVNKYGIDMRVSQLIRRCPNIRTMTLGHPTSVQPDTIGLIAKYCRKLHTFNIGGLESWPFMLECDFSGLKQLHTIHFSTTPLMAHSLYTLPTRTLRHVCLEKMDALTVDELRIFLKNRPNIETLAILHCRRLTKDLGTVISSKIGGTLDQLELAGSQITDDNIRRMFQEQGHLSVLRLHRTWITDATLEAIRTGRLFIKHLDISYNKHITNEAVKALFVSFRGRMTLNVSGCDQVDVSL
ncbi:uncharacterized protein BYT42DRAFT_569291 [Radiomyces spectabilis]|uniref:uncharacterized protein n=1 Tax=Radiomyces spectabilis TaxID=64574 RepID=UPI002220EC56|nr:uncharacterized protein BYT42DRAFT_569291 [Radiomyces spectabilis]KAI8379580.1 hypothetical protein BYT42DRAFT_569291 [Radiomyces spectabilis]